MNWLLGTLLTTSLLAHYVRTHRNHNIMVELRADRDRASANEQRALIVAAEAQKVMHEAADLAAKVTNDRLLTMQILSPNFNHARERYDA